MKLFLVTLFSFAAFLALGNELKLDTAVDEVSINEFCFNINDSANVLTIESAIQGAWKHIPEGPKFGYSSNYQWLKVSVENPYDVALKRFFFVPYSHINEIQFFVLEGDSVIKQSAQGTSKNYHGKDFKSRGYPFQFSIDPHQKLDIILRLDHRFLPLRATSFITTKERLREIVIGSEYLIWFWRGIFLFAIFIAAVLTFSVKLKLFRYYLLFNLGLMFFMGTELGDFFYFFDQDPNNNISDIKHLANFLIIYYFPMFINELTPLKKLFPRIWKWMYYSGHPLFILIPLGFLTATKNTSFYFLIDVWMLTWAMLVLFLQLILLIPAALKRERNALVLLIVYGIYIGALCVNVILPAIGVTTESAHVNNGLLVGMIFEILTFLLLMGRETLGIYRDRSNLLEKQKYHQREMLVSVVEIQENERNRVGRELHDMVGANMSVIKLQISDTNAKLRSLVESTIEDIRMLSHGMVTPRVSGDQFTDEVKELCGLATTDELKLYPYFHNWSPIENEELATHLFRIVQELIQNAVKHSRGKEVHLQIVRDKNTIEIMYEDDGVGFKLNKARSSGVGLKGIENRVQLLNGSMLIAPTFKNKGASISITVPYS